MKRILLYSLIAFTWFPASAKDRVKVSGEDTYYTTASESPALARVKAIEMARVKALSEEFGTIISGQSMMVSSDHSQSSMIIGISDVNGEWLGDINEPQVTSEVIGRDYLYTARVEGWARELSHERIDVDGRLLCNGTDKERDRLRDGLYMAGDEMFYYFVSPVDGYLALFLGDEEEKLMQCLLPYGGQDLTVYPVKANQEYVFFSKELAPADDVDFAAGLIVDCRSATDYNTFYAIFSPNEFSGTVNVESKSREFITRVGDKEINLMPRETNYNTFQKWLAKQRTRDPRMQVSRTLIAIRAR